MANINDYLKWRGDLPLGSTFPFNEIDSMVLARFSYLTFDKIEMEPEETIGSISDKMSSFKEEDFRYHGDRELIQCLGKSSRFRDMKVTDFINDVDTKAEKQFSAITIHYFENQMYLSFMGTDSSLVGWKEDFNMAFMSSVPAQIEGTSYAVKMANKYPEKRIRLGGHSKGGNVAIYAAVRAPEEVKRRLISVDNYDGPGFSEAFVKEHQTDDVLTKIHTYIPQESVIGRILEHAESHEIVLSNEKMLQQHDLYSWQVMKDRMIRCSQMSEEGDAMYQTLARWVDGASMKDRQLFIDGMYQIAKALPGDSFDDLTTQMISNLPTVMKTYMSFPPEQRKTVLELWLDLARLNVNSHTERMKRKA